MIGNAPDFLDPDRPDVAVYRGMEIAVAKARAAGIASVRVYNGDD